MVLGSQKSEPPLKPESGSLRTTEDGRWAQSNESDEGLMARFCDGDLPAFEVLFQRYGQVIRAYLARLVGAVHADDLAQATFFSVVRARGRFDRKAHFKPWLYAIATNAARDYFRRRREELTQTGELSSERADEGGSEESSPGWVRSSRRLQKYSRAAFVAKNSPRPVSFLPNSRMKAVPRHEMRASRERSKTPWLNFPRASGWRF